MSATEHETQTVRMSGLALLRELQVSFGAERSTPPPPPKASFGVLIVLSGGRHSRGQTAVS